MDAVITNQISRENGVANKLLSGDRAAHDWYRFVLSFPPQLVREYLARFGITQEQTVLDPFCGTGTTLVECKKSGIPSVGIEANPMAYFASKVKLHWEITPKSLFDHANRVAETVRRRLTNEGIEDYPALSIENRELNRDTLKSLPENQLNLLLTDSISPLPLHKTLVLLEELHAQKDDLYFDHELLALGKALVSSIGNLHFGPEVGVGTPKSDTPVVAAWLTAVETMVRDLRDLRSIRDCPSEVINTDARGIINVLKPNSIDAVITSPPYPNEKDYSRTTRLESVILGFINSKAELQSMKKTLLRSNTRNVYKGDDDDQWVMTHRQIQEIADKIEARRLELGKTSGFERLYPKVTKLYFGGIARHLGELRTVLRPGAQLAYVVGDQASYLRVMIRTGQLIADIAQSLGYEVQGIDLFRTRLATATKEQLREEVVLLRYAGC